MNVGDECVLAELKPELTIEAVLEFVIEGNGPKRCGELVTSEDGVIEEFVKVDALKIEELNAGTCDVTNGLEEVWGTNGLEEVFEVNGFEEVWGRNEVDKVWRANGFEGLEEN